MCCDKPIKTTSVVVSGSKVNITIPTTTLTAPEILSICIQQSIPTIGYGYPVTITNGSTTYNVFDRCGNYVIGGELCPRHVYKFYYNDFPSHFTVVSDLRKICNKTAATIGRLDASNNPQVPVVSE